MDILGFAGDVMDTPGRLTRTALAGRNPLDALFDPSQGVSGRDLLQQYGLVGENQDGLDAGDVGGFAAEMALDPTNWIGGGLLKRLLGKASGAKAANLAATPNYFHATRATDEALSSGFKPHLGRMYAEPEAVYLSSSADDAMRATGRNPTRAVPVRAIPTNSINQDGDAYKAAWLDSLRESHAASTKLGKSHDDLIDFPEELAAMLHYSDTPPGRLLADKLKSAGYDSVVSKFKDYNGDDLQWLMALDPSIVSNTSGKQLKSVPPTSPLLAALLGHNAVARSNGAN